MFIQNQINHLPNHFEIINNEIVNSNEILLVVSYVRTNGVDLILDDIKDKNIKLLCSFDMGITQLEAIEKLLEIKNIEIKIYKSREGTFHSKIWLFKNNKKWNSIIGSANLTKAALLNNVEASVLLTQDSNSEIVTNSIIFFNYLWNNENSVVIDKEIIDELIQQSNKRSSLKMKSSELPENENEIIELLFEYVKSWIDISKDARTSNMLSSLWRGWYIIPDQGYINDDLMLELKSYVDYIHSNGGNIELSKRNPSEKYTQLLNLFATKRNYDEENLTLSLHDLFVRQAKNYLIKFEWLIHPIKNNGKPDKSKLHITELGNEIAKCKKISCIKNLYSDFLYDYHVNGLQIIPFTLKVIEKTNNHLTIDEISMFLIHSYVNEDAELVINLVNKYRNLSTNGKEKFINEYRAYFDEIKEPTGKSVYGNYLKKVKHTISTIGWTNYFDYDKDFTLKKTTGIANLI